jgi:hypothetical protein
MWIYLIPRREGGPVVQTNLKNKATRRTNKWSVA